MLEIGCGTGQFTRQLAGRAFNLTAIDIGAAMVQTARRNVADPAVRFQTCSFEDFAGSGPFDLIVSATAFHWLTALRHSGLFGQTVEVNHTRTLRIPAQAVGYQPRPS